MPEQIQAILEVIKDYGAALVSTIAAGGLAGIASIVMKIKDSVAKSKDDVASLVNKEAKTTTEIKEQLALSIQQTNDLQAKLDKLTKKIDKLEE